MGKTFVLTLLGLTAVLGLGGGVLNMIRLDEVTVRELMRVMALVLPVAATLTLPIAAMYSAATTYGRLAADNELTACRSGGVNVHTLLAPTFLLSLLSAIVTFLCLNFVIPGMVQNLDAIIGADLESLIRQRLNSPGRSIPGLNRYRLYTDAFDVKSEDRASRITLTGVAFLEMDSDEVTRVGTASDMEFLIDRRASAPVITGQMKNVTYYDRKQDSFVDQPAQDVGPVTVPLVLPPRIKFLDLPDLYHFRRRPAEWVDVREGFEALRVGVGRAMAYHRFADEFTENRPVALTLLTGGQIEIQPDGAATDAGFEINADDGSLMLRRVQVVERQGGQQRTMSADRATVEITSAQTIEECQVQIDLYGNVLAPDFGQARESARPRESRRLHPARLPAQIAEQVAALEDESLLSSTLTVGDDPRVVRKRAELTAEIAATVRKITGVVHQRFSFTASVFVLGLLAAALGIIFNQSQLLVSVGISMIPGALVLVTILMGKQLAENQATELVGLAVMWGGLGLVAALDAWLLLCKVRR